MGVKKVEKAVAAKAAKPRSPGEVAKLWKAAEAEIEKHRKAHSGKGNAFTSVSKEEFEKKLGRVESPIITSQGWSNSVPAGGNLTYSVGVFNPDAFSWGNLSVSVSFGNRNAILNNDQFMTTFDARFPTAAKPQPFGFSIGPGASVSHSFTIKIPATIDKQGYFGNTALIQLSFHDIGKYFDRAVFFFDVV
jgi:hypothetical protein